MGKREREREKERERERERIFNSSQILFLNRNGLKETTSCRESTDREEKTQYERGERERQRQRQRETKSEK